MLRVDAKVTKPHIGDAGGDMVSLVDGEPIKPGRDCGAHDRGRHEKSKEAAGETYAWFLPVACAQTRYPTKTVIRVRVLRSAFGRHFESVRCGWRQSILSDQAALII